MAKYYCVLLDADNTLLDFDAAESKALQETFEHFGIEASSENCAKYREINGALWRQLEKGELRREKLLQERFARLLSALGQAGDGAEMNRFYLEKLATHADVLPDAPEVVRELAEVATLAVVSNGVEAVQKQRIADSGLAQWMEGVFISEQLGCEKPNRRFFEQALRELGVENRKRVLVVGDSLGGDIQGGINAGLDTCWANLRGETNTTGIQPVYEIHQLDELYKIIMEEEELTNVGNKNRKHMV